MDTNLVTVSFPGLGIGEFTLKKSAVSIGSITIYWYAVFIVCGMITAFFYAKWRSKQEKIKLDDLIDIALFTILSGIVGARLYYVLTTLDSGSYKNFIDVIAIWKGGLAIYGGIIGGGIAMFITCRIKKINPLRVFDAAAPGAAIAQAMGRWGNFFNGEAFGAKVTEGHPLYFMRMGLESGQTFDRFGETGIVYVHPTFLYESLWNVAGFIIMNILYKRKKFNGQIFLVYLGWYGFGRMFIEGLRMDSLYVGSIRISQLVGGLCAVVCAGLIAYGLVRAAKDKKNGVYVPVFSKPEAAAQSAGNEETKSDDKTSGDTEVNPGSDDNKEDKNENGNDN